MELSTKTQIRNFVQEDIPFIMKLLNEHLEDKGYPAATNTKFNMEFDDSYDDNEWAKVTFKVTSGKATYEVEYMYIVKGENIYTDIGLDELAEAVSERLEEEGIAASTRIKAGTRIMSSRRRIVAADEDEFDDFEDDFDDEVDEEVEENIDDIADTVDDMQDWLEDVEEDDIDIDVDANISNHYIVQCDSCHDIFISALVETDQDVEKISGVCPCCEKSSDQYIKWVVREIGKE